MAGLDATDQDALAALSSVERDTRLDELATSLGAAAAGLAEQAEAAARELARCQDVHRAAEVRASRLDRFAAAVTRLQRHEVTRADYEQARDVVAAADRAAPVRPLIEVLDEAQAAYDCALGAVPGDDVAADAADISGQAVVLRRFAAELRPLMAREAEAAGLAVERDQAARAVGAGAAESARLDRRQQARPALVQAAEQAVRSAEVVLAGAAGLHSRRASLAARAGGRS